jgi:hypothetical protein
MSKYSSARLLKPLLVLFGIMFLADTALTTIILRAGGRELNCYHPINFPICGEHPNLIYLWAVRFALLGFLCWATLKLSSTRPKLSLAFAYVLTTLSLAGVCLNGIVVGCDL